MFIRSLRVAKFAEFNIWKSAKNVTMAVFSACCPNYVHESGISLLILIIAPIHVITSIEVEIIITN